MKKRNVLTAATLVLAGAAMATGVKALADGIPSPEPLWYTGTLTESGALVTGTRSITINLWPDGTTAGAPLCTTTSASTAVTNGQFRVQLPATCKTVINQNAGVYVEVLDGTTSVGRVAIGAVPYAVEADHSVSTDNATPDGGITASLNALQAQVSALQDAGVHPPSAFRAYLVNGDAAVEQAPIHFDQVEFDLGGEYSATTGLFSPTNTGEYYLQCTVETVATENTDWTAALVKGGSGGDGAPLTAVDVNVATGGGLTVTANGVFRLIGGHDTVACQAWNGWGVPLATSIGAGRNNFYGVRLY